MKLRWCESINLKPSFSDNMNFLYPALDVWIREFAAWRFTIAAPLTINAVGSCTQEELEALYKTFSVVPYYSDIPIESQRYVLYAQATGWYGTGDYLAYAMTPYYISSILNEVCSNADATFTFDDKFAFTRVVYTNGESIDGYSDSNLLHKYNLSISINGVWLETYLERVYNVLDNCIRDTAKLNELSIFNECEIEMSSRLVPLTESETPVALYFPACTYIF